MTDMRIKQIVIAGGGTAGWMAAAAFSKVLGNECSIRLVESEEIGTIGVGEGTVPHLKLFNDLLGVDDVEFVRNTQGTFKLGIQFNDWARPGDSYVHGFGEIGHDISLLPFHQFWIKARQRGVAEDIGAYSLNTVAAPRGRFMPSATDVPANSPLANVAYAYHFDAGLYARFLRRYAEQRGVRRSEGRIASIEQRPDDGFVAALVMESGERIDGDLFIDCTGFRGLLIEQTLHTGYHDFSHWLPCDRAMAVGCERVAQLAPYTRSTARAAGWQWRIPLQHRTGNGHVYCSEYMSDDEAAAVLLANLDGKPLGEPRLLRFTTGARKQAWNRNVVALGLAVGFLEPLESTSIYMIQSGIARLLDMWPQRDFSPVLIDRYNARSRFEYEHLRDFLILHYYANQRDDSPFWKACRTMALPSRLEENIRLFCDSGRFYRDGDELFVTQSWVQVMVGQRLMPRGYHPLVDQMPEKDLTGFMASVSRVVNSCVDAMPMHQAFIDRVCPATALESA